MEMNGGGREEENNKEFTGSAAQLQPNLEDVSETSSLTTAAESSTTQEILNEISPLPESVSKNYKEQKHWFSVSDRHSFHGRSQNASPK